MNALIRQLSNHFAGYNRIREFTIPAETTIDRNQLIDCFHILYNAYGHKFSGYYSYIEMVRDTLEETGLEWITKAGKFTKRLAKVEPIFEPYMGTLGDLITKRAISLHPAKWYLSLSEEIFWRDGNFGHSGSCWWGCYGESRDVFTAIGGITLLWHRPTDNSYNGIGRVFIAPHNEDDDVLLMFNQYGEVDERPIRIEQSARLLTQILPGTKFISADLINDSNECIPFINGNMTTAIVPDNGYLSDGYSFNVQWGEDNQRECAGCGYRYDEDDMIYMDGELYCEDCYRDTFTCCTHCGEEIYRNDAHEYNGDEYCERCYDRYFTECQECNDILPRDESLVGYYNGMEMELCEYCYDRYYLMCQTCSDATHRDDLDQDGNCPNCHQEEPAQLELPF